MDRCMTFPFYINLNLFIVIALFAVLETKIKINRKRYQSTDRLTRNDLAARSCLKPIHQPAVKPLWETLIASFRSSAFQLRLEKEGNRSIIFYVNIFAKRETMKIGAAIHTDFNVIIVARIQATRFVSFVVFTANAGRRSSTPICRWLGEPLAARRILRSPLTSA